MKVWHLIEKLNKLDQMKDITIMGVEGVIIDTPNNVVFEESIKAFEESHEVEITEVLDTHKVIPTSILCEVEFVSEEEFDELSEINEDINTGYVVGKNSEDRGYQYQLPYQEKKSEECFGDMEYEIEELTGNQVRKCDKCDEIMQEGYVIEGGFGYWCSDECLFDEEYTKKMHDNREDDDLFWTEWY